MKKNTGKIQSAEQGITEGKKMNAVETMTPTLVISSIFVTQLFFLFFAIKIGVLRMKSRY